MSSQPHKLTGRHRDTVRHVFAHPLSHNVEWHAVLALLHEVADVTEGDDGTVEVHAGGQQVVLKRPHDKDLEPDDLLVVRHFLESLGYGPDDA